MTTEDAALAGPRVYYAQDQHDGLIKIGFSKNVERRLASAATAYRRAWMLLATEAGGPDLEKRRHEQFRALRVHEPHLHVGETDELFRPEDALLRHLRRLDLPSGERVYGKLTWERRQVRLSPYAAEQLDLHMASRGGLSLHKLVEEAILNEIQPGRRWSSLDVGWSLNAPA